MTISYQWLMDYLPSPLPLDELSNILTSIGLEVEGTETVGGAANSFEGLVAGEVLTCEKHPDADKLKITTINIGSGEPLHIVCGAPNVAAGQKVIVATIGTTLHPVSGEPFKIKKSKIRGALSEGMLCAEDEIGIGESHAGIMVLPEDTVVGTPIKEVLNLPQPDTAIHIGLTPNRADAMSHIGVARDVCAYLSHHTGKEHRVVMPQFSLPEASDNADDLKVFVDATEACPRYAGISLTGLQIAPSPEWLQQRLKTIGLRPINNVVDITNFVQHEYGQPLHAFDRAKISGNEVHVRFEAQGTPFLALDGKEFKLRADDLMICDAEKGMCIAGVFGGKESGVSDATTSIFLESAHFNRQYIRRTSMHHGLRTDAATRFEKGADIENVLPALRRAAALMVELCGATIASAVTDIYPQPVNQTKIEVTLEYIQRLSGKNYPAKAVSSILAALGFGVEAHGEDAFTLTVPTSKIDVLQPADIVEEILRIDGLDNIAIPGRLNIALLAQKEDNRAYTEKLSTLLFGLGFQEIVTNSITNSKYYEDEPQLVRMLNSLTSELDVMRPRMLESGLEVVSYNVNRRNENLQLFEWGKVYHTSEGGYDEKWQLGLWLTGVTRIAGWQEGSKPLDVFYIKGLIQDMFQRLGIRKGITETVSETGEVTWSVRNKTFATAVQVPAETAKKFDIKQPVYHAIIHWDAWVNTVMHHKIRYAEVPKYPAVSRDLSIVIDNNVSYQQVKGETEGLKIDFLKGFDLFDVFKNDKLGEGKKAYALSYIFQRADRTLTDKEIDEAMQRLIGAYRGKLGAIIRE